MRGEGLFGVDFGKVRIGVSAADALGMLAHPRATLDVKGCEPSKVVADYLASHQARHLILGMPRQLDGGYGQAAKDVHAFREALQARLPALKITLWDERLTTAAAQKQLAQAGRNAKSSRKVIDQAAAVGILQSYLDSQAAAEDCAQSSWV